MSDDTSAPRGRYAQPRRRRHAQKGRQRQEQATQHQDGAAFDADDMYASRSSSDREDFADERFSDAPLGNERAPFEGDEAPAHSGYSDEYSEEVGAFEDEIDYEASRGEPAESDYDHDYLGREGVQSRFDAGFDHDDDFSPEAVPARAREFDEPEYERGPLRDRSLPPPPDSAAIVSAHEDLDENLDDANLTVTGIGKSYKRRPVVRDVSLEVRRGEIVGLLGPNGAGKTTCFYMITGLVPADRGSIQLMGRDLTRLPMYQRARMGLSYLPQEVSIFRGMTVEQNIRAILELSEPSAHRREARLDQLLAEFSISRLRNSPAIALSGGERRRVEIARCLAADPSFILLDEPFAGVDPIAVGDIRSLVWQLKDRGIGVLITDHNVRETLEIIDRAYILHDGRVLMEGAPQDVINDENVRRVYLGEGFRI